MNNDFTLEERLHTIEATLKTAQLAAERKGLDDEDCNEVGWLLFAMHREFVAMRPAIDAAIMDMERKNDKKLKVAEA
jgi:hypothetical protein